MSYLADAASFKMFWIWIVVHQESQPLPCLSLFLVVLLKIFCLGFCILRFLEFLEFPNVAVAPVRHFHRCHVSESSSSPSDACVLPFPPTHTLAHHEFFGQWSDRLKSVQGLVKLIQTLVFSHTAPPDYVWINTGLQCISDDCLCSHLLSSIEKSFIHVSV